LQIFDSNLAGEISIAGKLPQNAKKLTPWLNCIGYRISAKGDEVQISFC